MSKKGNIGQHELIGLDVEVVAASDGSLIGIQGTIVDETKNTFLLKKKTMLGKR